VVLHERVLFASGRVEETICLFSQKFAFCANFCEKRQKEYHAAASEAGVWVYHQAGIGRTT
jgi:hypothetical protein